MLDLHLEGIITRLLFVYMCAVVYMMMSRLIAKAIIRSYSMWQRRIGAVKPPIGIVSNCDFFVVSMFNAQCYMHMNGAYFAPSTIPFPYELKEIFDQRTFTSLYIGFGSVG